METIVFANPRTEASQWPTEYVERKGLGHPDSICDSIMEAAAQSLRHEYQQRCGRILHHNLDKALLVAGQSAPEFGGGTVLRPIKIIAGDRASSRCGEWDVPVADIVEQAVNQWIKANLRFVIPEDHIEFHSEIHSGSEELRSVFDRQVAVANDTSAAVGFAPLSETEQIVLQTEQFINSRQFKERFPVAGEDVKVMAARHRHQLHLTIAVAMVDRFVADPSDYTAQKMAMQKEIREFVQGRLPTLELTDVAINTLDDPALGVAGTYLTVVGTSAECGDGGEVGRGNAVNGLICLNRPTANEAAAGKNTTSHVGKIYNHLSFAIAEQIVDQIGPVRECYVWLCSQIGRRIDDPWAASVGVTLDPSVTPTDVQDQINTILQTQLSHPIQ